MAIKRIQELEFKKTLTALIYGQKGAGKTILVLSASAILISLFFPFVFSFNTSPLNFSGILLSKSAKSVVKCVSLILFYYICKNIINIIMNRIILIGNGFDLEHNLKTSYNDLKTKEPNTKNDFLRHLYKIAQEKNWCDIEAEYYNNFLKYVNNPNDYW